MAFTIWIDADSCPAPVRNHVASFCEKHDAKACFVANRVIPLPQTKQKDRLCLHVCPAQDQAADDYIFLHAGAHDACITRDIPFAAKLVEKGICVMNDRGTVFTKENIRERLSERDFSLNLAMLGLGISGTKRSYDKKDFKKFADCFEREMQKLLILDTYGEPRHQL